ncbi:GTP-binding protein [Ramlibacter albus]|uniref:ATP/GTP-binding protein n=1 Tax=Ramlibacter albus TaxID=2079448 RepID=A0A923S4R9_9BURK|nr:ATP/GTP-binding protein [Ramlibacter albus]MBC5767810.1 ATP/GTP-binding protein [Ramlibacter albus]
MTEYKILFTGTMGAGKTTAIGQVTEIPPVITDVANSDPSLAKARTTVGLDFGVLSLDSGDRIRLFGTPGQARFDFLWKILARNALGLVILADNSRPQPLEDLKVYLEGFAQEIAEVPCVIGVTRCDITQSPTCDDYADTAASMGVLVPVIPVDVRQRDDVLLLIDSLLAQIEVEWTEDHE